MALITEVAVQNESNLAEFLMAPERDVHGVTGRTFGLNRPRVRHLQPPGTAAYGGPLLGRGTTAAYRTTRA